MMDILLWKMIPISNSLALFLKFLKIIRIPFILNIELLLILNVLMPLKKLKRLFSNHKLGASVFVCPNDNEVYFCHHTCKGKLCSSCGIKSQKIKTQNILEKCINTKHRHITFAFITNLLHYVINLFC